MFVKIVIKLKYFESGHYCSHKTLLRNILRLIAKVQTGNLGKEMCESNIRLLYITALIVLRRNPVLSEGQQLVILRGLNRDK